jgi:HEAT repeat protein
VGAGAGAGAGAGVGAGAGGNAGAGAGPPAGSEDAPVFAEVNTARAVVTRDAKLLCTRPAGTTTAGRCALYDLATDAGETHDAAAERPSPLAALTGALAAFDRDLLARPPARTAADPAETALARAGLGDVTALPAVRALVASASTPAPTRARAAVLLERLGDRDSAAALVALALDATNPLALRHAAADAAGLLGEPAARAVLLGLGPPPPPYDPARHFLALGTLAAAAATAAHGRDAAAADAAWLGLCECIGHPTAEVRDRALGLLAALRDPRAAPALVAALEAWQTRPAAAEALGALGDPAHLPALERALAAEAQLQNRGRVLAAVAAIRGPRADAVLRAALGGPDDTIGVLAALDATGRAATRAGTAADPGAGRVTGGAAVGAAAAGPGIDWRCEAATRTCEARAGVTRLRPAAPRAPCRAGATTLVLDLRAPSGAAAPTVEVRAAGGGALLAVLTLAHDFREHHVVLPPTFPSTAPELELRWGTAKSADAFGSLRYAAFVCTTH